MNVGQCVALRLSYCCHYSDGNDDHISLPEPVVSHNAGKDEIELAQPVTLENLKLSSS